MVILKRLAGSKWGCARSTLIMTYCTYILPVLLYCCEPLITAPDQTLQQIEKIQNQALRLITGGVKTTPTDAMLLITGLKPIRNCIEERALLLYEKLIRSVDDNFWSTYENAERRLKTQEGFIQKALQLKSRSYITSLPQLLQQQQHPLLATPVKYNLNLQEYVVKRDLDILQLKLIAIDTINSNYPEAQWLHVYTDGSQIEGQVNVGAGIYCKLFSIYKAVGKFKTAYDGEIEAIYVALHQLTCHLEKFDNVVILSDSQAAIQSIASLENTSTEISNCKTIIQNLQNANKTVVLQWIPGHCQIFGNDQADALAKKATSILQTQKEYTSYTSVKRYIRKVYNDHHVKQLTNRTSQKQWNTSLLDLPDWPRRNSVALFRLHTGHDCLAKHLHRFGMAETPFCPLCKQKVDMDRHHLNQCPALTTVNECDRYWEARSKMGY